MPAEGWAAREAAFEILRATSLGALFEAARDRAVRGLQEPDRRLAHEIAAGVLRHRRELDRKLQRILERGWRRTTPEVRELLRIGAYQILRLSRVPPYAAVSTTVEVAKRRTGNKSAAFVNAVLRRLLHDEQAASVDQGSAPVPVALAARYSHPDWLVKRWTERFGSEATERLLRHNNQPPPLVIQPLNWTRDQLEEALSRRGIAWAEAKGGYGLVVKGVKPREIPGYEEGAFLVQGPAQARFVREAAIPAGWSVWDACAAPGGKAALLSLAHRVLASDSKRRRLRRMMETFQRARSRAVVFIADARMPPLREQSIDAVWLDVPCSATGTLARHPDARWRLSLRRIVRLAELQGELLDGAAPVVRPGGLLVYSTCSLEPEENEDRVNQFLAAHPDFRRDRGDLFLFPPDTESDGGYLAILRRD
ncbi:Ribosomal RNA small subunit methyltransferase B [bacterium HR33]|nr:Ribosomal RNA small subunit methyltransferase B [bacterium HR33]